MRKCFLIRSLFAAAALACFAPAVSAAPAGMTMPGMSMPLKPAMPGMSVYNLSSHWTNEAGKQVDLPSLRGTPLVMAMVYTNCKDVCPLTAERMQEIEAALPAKARGSVHFALFSMDWVRDTPQQLARFAAEHHLDLAHWTLFHGDEPAVRKLAAVLGVSLYRNPSGDFQHSIAIFLLDADGVVQADDTDLQKPPTATIAKMKTLLAR
jgi:protein SCO1/2